MFLPFNTPQNPGRNGLDQKKTLPAAAPAEVVDALLKDVFTMRSWSPEQRLRYTENLDPVLRAHLNGQKNS